MQTTDTFDLTLTEMVYGGNALGKLDGKPIFVPYGIAGERIAARITQDKGRFAFAEVVEVLDAAPSRVPPPCALFGAGRCGGCHWQHIDYAAQLAFKRQIVAEQFRRVGGFTDVTVHPTLASPDPWRYRTHVNLHITPDGKPGYVGTDDERVMPVDLCHIVRPELQEMLTTLHTRDLRGLSRVRLQVGTDGSERLLGISTTDNQRPTAFDFPASVSLISEQGYPKTLSGSGRVHYTLNGRTFQTRASSFFQVNLAQARALVDLVLDRLALSGGERALDLYSGVGLFTAFLAERVYWVTAIEVFPPAVQDALTNLDGFDNVDVIEGALEAALPRLKGAYGVVVLDPPRAGVKPKALDALVKRAPSRIVYVSCDPTTLARDAKHLVGHGYRLLDVQPIDMFPQTYHIEAVATFERTGSN